MNACNFRALPSHRKTRRRSYSSAKRRKQGLELMSFHFRLGGIRERAIETCSGVLAAASARHWQSPSARNPFKIADDIPQREHLPLCIRFAWMFICYPTAWYIGALYNSSLCGFAILGTVKYIIWNGLLADLRGHKCWWPLYCLIHHTYMHKQGCCFICVSRSVVRFSHFLYNLRRKLFGFCTFSKLISSTEYNSHNNVDNCWL